MIILPEKSSFKNKKLFLFLLLFLLSDCANQLPPGGGEIDYIPPEIIEVFPPDGTTGFNEEYIELGFSEYVDKRSVKDAIFISPAIEGNPELDWSGKYVRIYFPGKLKEDVTYVVTIGTDVVDFNNKNRMAEAFTLTFATGEKIDRKVIAGKVYNEKNEGIFLLAYKIDSIDPDTLNPSSVKPDYISQAGKNGLFKIAGLSAGTYRIFAVQDEFRDLLFQPAQDKIGVPSRDITLSEDDTLVSGLNFSLTAIDTVAPRLLNAVQTDRFHILLTLSEEIDSTIIKSAGFSIIDSSSGKKVNPLFAFKGNTKPPELLLALRDSFPADHNVFVFIDTIRDRAKNIYLNDFSRISLSELADTTKPKLYKAVPSANSNRADFQGQEFFFYFDDGFDTSFTEAAIAFRDTSKKTIPFSIRFFDDASFKIKPDQKLEPEKDYIIEFNLAMFRDAAGNHYDSVYQYKFKTLSGLDFTGLSGTLLNIEQEQNPVIVLQSIAADGQKYVQKLNDNYTFDMRRIDPDKYRVWAYLDRDSSGTYSSGYPFPFIFSEEFSFYKDTLDLRPRWVQTDLKFLFK